MRFDERADLMVLKIVYFFLLISFYGNYFLKQIMLRKKNIKTNRLAKGSKPQKVVNLEKNLLILTYLTAVLQFASLFYSSFTDLKIVSGTGIVITGIGILLFLFATVHMKESWRAGIDQNQNTELIVSGIYQYSRNPAFVGFDLFYIGTILMQPNIPLIISVVLTIYFLHLQILEEEKYLKGEFGETYLNYKNKVRRYL